MEIWHRIAFTTTKRPQLQSMLDKLQIEYEVSPSTFGKGQDIIFEISESAPQWVALQPHVDGIFNMVETNFSEEELRRAEWVRLIPVFQQGYPQPESKWVTTTPEYQILCESCGTYNQIHSFKIKKEPRLGKHDFMSLYWVYALFCAPAVLKTLQAEKIKGFDNWDVLLYKSETISKEISQLFIDQMLKPGLTNVEELKRIKCKECNVTKYHPHKRGIINFKKGAFEDIDGDLVLTHEWFGYMKDAYREILVSNRLAQLILDKKWKGLHMKVAELVD